MDQTSKDTEKRTFAWYVMHSPKQSGGLDGWWSKKATDTYGNAPGIQDRLDNLQKAGVLDQVPSLENAGQLFSRYTEWYDQVNQDWNVFERENKAKGLMVTLHWALADLLHDPNLDPRLVQYVFENCMRKFAIDLAHSPALTMTNLKDLVAISGSKQDPTKTTKGGELVCFILQNKSIPSEIVDLCAKKAKKGSNQKNVISHPNVSRETLVFLSEFGKSDKIKRDSVYELTKRGWLNVKG